MQVKGGTTDPVVGDGKPRANDNEIRSAMLSVYYQTIGRQFEVRGAPSVLLPPEVQVMSLEEALDVLALSPTRLREALWRIIQSVPLNVPTSSSGLLGYPNALVRYFKSAGLELEHLVELRRSYRSGANVFTAALIACRDNDPDLLKIMIGVLESRSVDHNFSATILRLLNVEAAQYLKNMISAFAGKPEKLVQQIARIESEIGCGISDLVDKLADVAAFEEFIDLPRPQGATRVYPVCSIVQQDTQSLVTTATVTTIVQGAFADLCRVIDPANWAPTSLVVSTADYITGPLDPQPPKTKPVFGKVSVLPDGRQKSFFLNEVAEIAWNGNSDQQATFHNVLNILTSMRPQPSSVGQDTGAYAVGLRQADVVYNLCRSIDSTVLWDKRAGGLLLNQGFIKLRELGNDHWRVTMRKQLKFSDRTPFDNGLGWRDFGQLANYLTPATLTWWLECETYGLADDGAIKSNELARNAAAIGEIPPVSGPVQGES